MQFASFTLLRRAQPILTPLDSAPVFCWFKKHNHNNYRCAQGMRLFYVLLFFFPYAVITITTMITVCLICVEGSIFRLMRNNCTSAFDANVLWPKIVVAAEAYNWKQLIAINLNQWEMNKTEWIEKSHKYCEASGWIILSGITQYKTQTAQNWSRTSKTNEKSKIESLTTFRN